MHKMWAGKARAGLVNMRVILTDIRPSKTDWTLDELIAGALTQKQAETMVSWLNQDRKLSPDRHYVIVPENHNLKK